MKNAVTLCLLLLGLMACTPKEQITFTGRDPRILVDAEKDLSLEMNIPGILGYDQASRCLYVTLTDHSPRQLVAPVWPAGSNSIILKGKRGVSVPGAGPIVEGDPVFADAYAEHASDSFTHLNLPAACVPPDRDFVFISLDQARLPSAP